MNTLIVVPTYNEAENLETLCRRIAAAMPHADVLVMDDGSPDGSADLADQMFRDEPEFQGYRVVRRAGPRGLGRAYRDGFARALDMGYDRIVQMDADLSHDPAVLPPLVAASGAAGLAIGSRYCPGGSVRNWPARRLLLSRFACWYVQRVAGIPVLDATAGYRCWSAAALTAVDLATVKSEGYSFQVEMAYRAARAGVPIVEIPIEFVDRQFGRSKISRAVLMESFLMPWKLRLRPWRSTAGLSAGRERETPAAIEQRLAE